MALKTPIFVKKLKITCSLDHTIMFTFHQDVVQILIKYCMERLKTSNVTINNGSREEF